MPPEAWLRIAVRQWGRVWLNGMPLGRLYVRCHADEWRYQEFDLLPHLRVGRNVLAVLVHSVGAPGIPIPGVPPPQPILMRAEGGAGSADFSAADGWRFAPADAFLPAPRHNDLIGHEELRDLRREEPEWLLASYDDRAWRPATPCRQAPESFLPAPHRPLREEIHVPARIVEQGRLCPAWAAQSFPPSSRHVWWRICPAPSAQPLLFFHGYRLDSRLLVDGQEQELPLFPRMDWVVAYGSTLLNASTKAHEIRGSYPEPSPRPYPAPVPPLVFGWPQLPEGGDRIEWAESPDGPWTAGRVEPDWEHQRILDRIEPRRLCALGPDGVVDLRVTDETVVLVLEFPRSITMLPVLEFADASDGVEVELVYSERLSPMPGLRFPAVYRDRAVLRAGPQNWDVAMQYKSARCLEVIIRASGGFAHLRRVAAVYRHCDYDETGRFESSEPRLNAIWDICRNTMEAGSQDFIIHLLEVLHRLGERGTVLREIRRQWGAFLDAGLTTTPEYTPLNNDWRASVGHPWSASPSVYLIRSIAGLSPLAPGWTRVAVNPHLGDLRKLRVTVPTPQGLIEAEFFGTESGVAGRIAVPNGMQVQISDPDQGRRMEIVSGPTGTVLTAPQR